MSLHRSVCPACGVIVSFALATLLVSPALAHDFKPKKPATLSGPEPKNVQTIPDEGRDHLEPGKKWKYKHLPPTSGPHDPTSIKGGFFSKPQPFEKLVHSLEHGSIVIYYDNPAPPVMQQLKTWGVKDTGNWFGVIVTPLPGLGNSVILTAWNKLLRLDTFDPLQASAFIKRYCGKGPENGPNDNYTTP